jgi:hypothetical protein
METTIMQELMVTKEGNSQTSDSLPAFKLNFLFLIKEENVLFRSLPEQQI